MNVANKDLCVELYDVSGWRDTDCFYRSGDVYFNGEYEDYGMSYSFHELSDVPAFDIGYLIRKIPGVIDDAELVLYPASHGTDPTAAYETIYEYESPDWERVSEGKTLEDALCKLAIELFKQGVLKKESV